MGTDSRDIEIRSIFEEDLLKNKSELIEMLHNNFKLNFPHGKDMGEFANRAFEDMMGFKRDNSAILIGAFEKDTIIGFIWAYLKNSLGEKRIHIAHIVVESKVRSAGVGSKLLKNLEELAGEGGIKKIELMTSVDNQPAMKFYSSKGFSTIRVQLEKSIE